MARIAAVVWVIAIALLLTTATAAEGPNADSHDLIGIAVGVLAAGLVLSARLAVEDAPLPRPGITDYR